MNRRAFLCIPGLLIVARTVGAQQTGKVVRIGIIGAGDTDASITVRDALRALGWVEGKNAIFEYRKMTENTNYAARAAELVRLKVDLIVVNSTPAAIAAKAATSEIPVVFGMVSDPVASGIVASLARPGANMTGWSNMLPETTRKLLELFKELAPRSSRVAVVFDSANPGKLLEIKVLQAEAQRIGIAVRPLGSRSLDDIRAGFAGMTQDRPDGVVVLQDSLTGAHRKEIVDSLARSRLPAIYQISEFVDAGGLISYGLNRLQQHRRTAVYVDKILRGAKPGDLPVEQPTAFELVVNMRTAKALGITIPRSILLRAERVIE